MGRSPVVVAVVAVVAVVVIVVLGSAAGTPRLGPAVVAGSLIPKGPWSGSPPPYVSGDPAPDRPPSHPVPVSPARDDPAAEGPPDHAVPVGPFPDVPAADWLTHLDAGRPVALARAALPLHGSEVPPPADTADPSPDGAGEPPPPDGVEQGTAPSGAEVPTPADTAEPPPTGAEERALPDGAGESPPPNGTEPPARPDRAEVPAPPNGTEVPALPDPAGVPAPGAAYAWPPLPVPAVLTPFRAPAHAYGPGHRGVDLAGTAGQPVLAARAGTVVFAGAVAGRSLVSVQHDDGLRTTYEPVVPAVAAGAVVAAGSVLGLLEPGHPGCADARSPPTTVCLHWGVRRDRTDYLDPLVLLRPLRVRLLPVPDPWPA